MASDPTAHGMQTSDELITELSFCMTVVTGLIREARASGAERWTVQALEEEVRELRDLEQLRWSQVDRRQRPLPERGRPSASTANSRQRPPPSYPTPPIRSPQMVHAEARLGEAREALFQRTAGLTATACHLPAAHEMIDPSHGTESPNTAYQEATRREQIARRRTLAVNQLIRRQEQEMRELETLLPLLDNAALESSGQAENELPSYRAAARSPPPAYDWRDFLRAMDHEDSQETPQYLLRLELLARRGEFRQARYWY